MRSMRGGWAGYGTGSSFLMDFNMFSTISKVLDRDLDFGVGHDHMHIKSGHVAVTICKTYICGNTPTFYVYVIVSNLLCA